MVKRYIDGFVIPVPKNKVKEYQKISSKASKIWMKYGALQYVESVGEDLKSARTFGCTSFLDLTKVKRGETVIFAFIMYKSKAHRDRVNQKVMADPLLNADNEKMPFDMRRMAVGGFETIVNK